MNDQEDITIFKRLYVKISLMDSVKLGIGFVIGSSIAAFMVKFFWNIFTLLFIGSPPDSLYYR